MNKLITLFDIVKDYRKMRALDHVSAEFNFGITGLLGPNGAGKSTLIKVLLGLVRVNSGRGTVLGHDLLTEGRKIRAAVGYMPEDDCYIPGMSGVEVVRYSACLAGIPSLEALRRSHEILDFCGMGQERYRAIETYSTGMRQKIKFASAIVHDPKMLILDEPTSGLDPEERESLLNRVKVLAQKAEKSVIISTHILPDVQSICDDVIIVANGRITLSDKLENLNRPASPTTQVTVIDHGEPLMQHLRRSGYDVELNGSTGDLRITSNCTDLSQTIWSAAAQTGVAIHSVTPARNSLEQIFLDAIQESGDANS